MIVCLTQKTISQKKFGKALANAEEDAFLNGDGSGKPTGIFAQTNGGTHLTEVDALKS